MKPVLAIGWDVGGWVGKKQAVAVARWANGRPEWLGKPQGFRLNSLGRDWSLIDLARVGWPEAPHDILNNQRVVLAIDAPLAFPTAFAELLAGAATPTFDAGGPEMHNPFAYRVTDRNIFDTFKKKPLSASFDKLGNNATVAMVHTRRLRERGHLRVPPFDDVEDGIPIGIEVYPALVKLKRAHGDQEALRCNPSVEKLLPTGLLPGDECDACICALMALAFGHAGRIADVPTMRPAGAIDRTTRREGLIYYPSLPWAVPSSENE